MMLAFFIGFLVMGWGGGGGGGGVSYTLFLS